MPNIDVLRSVVHEKKIFKGFCYIILYQPVSPWVGAIYYHKNLICANLNFLVNGYSIPNINAIRPVIHEKKIFLRLPKLPLS